MDLRLNSLSLARLHDAFAAAHSPPAEMRNIEVRAMHGSMPHPNSPIKRSDSALSFRERVQAMLDPDRYGQATPDRLQGTPPGRLGRTFGDEVSANTRSDPEQKNAVGIKDLGRTHVNKHGRLASRSDDDNSTPPQTPPTREVTPGWSSSKPDRGWSRGKQQRAFTGSPGMSSSKDRTRSGVSRNRNAVVEPRPPGQSEQKSCHLPPPTLDLQKPDNDQHNREGHLKPFSTADINQQDSHTITNTIMGILYVHRTNDNGSEHLLTLPTAPPCRQRSTWNSSSFPHQVRQTLLRPFQTM